MSISRPLSCEPFPTSNDFWRPAIAKSLINRLQTMRTDHSNSTALVIGAGTLPFTLDVLPPTIVVADLYDSVVLGVVERCSFIANTAESWGDYSAAYAENSGIVSEFRNMQLAGLVRNFEHAKTAARRATIIPLVGDVILTAPDAFTDIGLSNSPLDFINLTNVANYLTVPASQGGSPRSGRRVLSQLIATLPVHDKTVICDSSFGQEPILYTPEQYSVL